MDFTVAHTLTGLAPEAFARLYFDEPFNEAMCQAVGLGRRLLALKQAGSQVKREVAVTPVRALPKPLVKVLGGAELRYVETVDFDFATGRGRWATVPSLLASKVNSLGDLTIAGDGKGGVVRTVSGAISVSLFAVGGAIERFIVDDIQTSYHDAAQFTQRYIDAQGR